MGKSQKRFREKVVAARVTLEEQQIIQAGADNAHRTTSEYLRELGLADARRRSRRERTLSETEIDAL
jgi:hypothetical protein